MTWDCVEKDFDSMLCKCNRFFVLFVEGNSQPYPLLVFLIPYFLVFFMNFIILLDLFLEYMIFLILFFLINNLGCDIFLEFNLSILFYGLFLIMLSLFNYLSFLFWFVKIFFLESKSLFCLADICSFLSAHLMIYLALQWNIINCTWN